MRRVFGLHGLLEIYILPRVYAARWLSLLRASRTLHRLLALPRQRALGELSPLHRFGGLHFEPLRRPKPWLVELQLLFRLRGAFGQRFSHSERTVFAQAIL